MDHPVYAHANHSYYGSLKSCTLITGDRTAKSSQTEMIFTQYLACGFQRRRPARGVLLYWRQSVRCGRKRRWSASDGQRVGGLQIGVDGDGCLAFGEVMTTTPSRWWDCSRYGDVQQPHRTLRSPDVRTSLVGRQTPKPLSRPGTPGTQLEWWKKTGVLERHSLWKIRSWPICYRQCHHRTKPVRVKTAAIVQVYY